MALTAAMFICLQIYEFFLAIVTNNVINNV